MKNRFIALVVLTLFQIGACGKSTVSKLPEVDAAICGIKVEEYDIEGQFVHFLHQNKRNFYISTPTRVGLSGDGVFPPPAEYTKRTAVKPQRAYVVVCSEERRGFSTIFRRYAFYFSESSMVGYAPVDIGTSL